MLDIFKGAAVTLLAWSLAIGFMTRWSSTFLWSLPVTSFVLPLLLPNGRWLFGSLVFTATIVALAFADSDGSWGAALVLWVLTCASGATLLGTLVRYGIREGRAWHRKRLGLPPLPEKKLPPIQLRSVALTVCSALALLAAYAVFVMYSAGVSARQVAAGRPYCIQIASGNGFRSLRSRFELLGFYMLSNGSQRHALLAVKNGSVVETYHWSYKNNAFLSDEYGPQPVHCVVAQDFLGDPGGDREISSHPHTDE